ncbi:MAG: hypothetical protein Kow0069_23580 [Promethearchaeota archaeon]
MKKFQTKSIFAIGMPGVGKTTYMASAYHALCASPDFRASVSPDSNADYFYDVIDHLASGRFPPSTPGPGRGFFPFSVEVSPTDLSRGVPTKFSTFDFSGKDLVNVLDNFDLFLQRVLEPTKAKPSMWFTNLSDFIRKSDGILFLAEPVDSKVKQIQLDEQYTKLFRLVYAILKGSRLSDGKPVRTPLALVLTKVDRDESGQLAADPAGHFKSAYPQTTRYVEDSFFSVKAFGCSSVGTAEERGEGAVPALPLKPVGVLDPLCWLLGYAFG